MPQLTSLYSGGTVRSNHWRFSLEKLFLKSSQYPQETPVLEVLFKNAAGLKACNFFKKRLQHRCFPANIAKFLVLLFSKNISERLLFDIFNGSLLRGPKGSTSRLYDGVRLQGLSHRSSFLFLSWHELSPFPRPCVRKSKTNTFDESIKFLYWLFLVVLDGFRSCQIVFRSLQVVLDFLACSSLQ